MNASVAGFGQDASSTQSCILSCCIVYLPSCFVSSSFCLLHLFSFLSVTRLLPPLSPNTHSPLCLWPLSLQSNLCFIMLQTNPSLRHLLRDFAICTGMRFHSMLYLSSAIGFLPSFLCSSLPVGLSLLFSLCFCVFHRCLQLVKSSRFQISL